MMNNIEDIVPRISVVMAVYNGERFLSEAIESVLNQTFTDFEFIIVDDGSTDATPAVLAEYQQQDARIRVLRNQPNQGIVSSLNRGFECARAAYIARMDADDISLPERLRKQYEFLEANTSVALLGSAAYMVDEQGAETGYIQFPASSGLIRWWMIFSNPLVHTSVMMRRDMVLRHNLYRPEFQVAQDYDLWARISLTDGIDNLPEPLVRYRVWGGNVSFQRRSTQLALIEEIAHRLMCHYLGRNISVSVTAFLCRAMINLPVLTAPEARETVRELMAIYRIYLQTVPVTASDKKAIAQDMALRCFRLAYMVRKQSLLESAKLAWRGVRYSPSTILKGIKRFGSKTRYNIAK